MSTSTSARIAIVFWYCILGCQPAPGSGAEATEDGGDATFVESSPSDSSGSGGAQDDIPCEDAFPRLEPLWEVENPWEAHSLALSEAGAVVGISGRTAD